MTLEGFDALHRLGMIFDNVMFDDLSAIKVSAKEADLQVGPGPFNLPVTGPDVKISGHAGPGAKNSCEGKFVPFQEPE